MSLLALGFSCDSPHFRKTCSQVFHGEEKAELQQQNFLNGLHWCLYHRNSAEFHTNPLKNLVKETSVSLQRSEVSSIDPALSVRPDIIPPKERRGKEIICFLIQKISSSNLQRCNLREGVKNPNLVEMPQNSLRGFELCSPSAPAGSSSS